MLSSLTVGGEDLHVVKLDPGGALNDYFDRLLSIEAADAAVSLQNAVVGIASIGYSCVKDDVARPHDVDSGDPIVIHLRQRMRVKVVNKTMEGSLRKGPSVLGYSYSSLRRRKKSLEASGRSALQTHNTVRAENHGRSEQNARRRAAQCFGVGAAHALAAQPLVHFVDYALRRPRLDIRHVSPAPSAAPMAAAT